MLSDGWSDCTEPDILGSRVLTAAILDENGVPDDGFGVFAQGQPSVRLAFAS